MRLTTLSTISILALAPLSMVSCSSQESKKITSVHDGDTFTDSKGVVYRLFGVDTPEVSDQYHNFKPTEGIEAIYGQQATLLAKNLILNKTCKIGKQTVDPYERVVASVSYKGEDLATSLLKKGLARVAYISQDPKNNYYTPLHSYYKTLLDAQYEAYENHLGIWERVSQMSVIFPKASL